MTPNNGPLRTPPPSLLRTSATGYEWRLDTRKIPAARKDKGERR
jgi:hypothetical protein